MSKRKTSPKNQSLSAALLIYLGIALLGFWGSQPAFSQSETASRLFDQLQAGVFQIRTVDLASGDKSSIGSGFAIRQGKFIATNFHVVSLMVHAPETYRLEIVGSDGQKTAASIAAIDVVHDLALLETGQTLPSNFALRRSTPQQGERIFSLGNPQDLGMTIIEGNYNGLVQKSRYQKILFSGSLNSGMSGGPAIDANGQVLGVNVAKGSEQISFLVPVQHLQALLSSTQSAVSGEQTDGDFTAQIHDDLHADQAEFFGELIEKDWQPQAFGDLMLPQNISDSLRCWGHTIEDSKLRYDSFHQHCRSNDAIYVSSDLYTGQFEFDFEWLDTEKLNTFQFYRVVEGRFDHKQPDNVFDEEDISEYQCLTDVTSIDDSRWKVSSCFRRYTDYPKLYDALLLMVSLDEAKKAGVLKAAASGISRGNAKALFRKLMGSITWTR